jgi:hypothetical protein
MQIKPLLSHILNDDALTRGLGDAEARVLVEWLVEKAERLALRARSQCLAQQEMAHLCLRGRVIGRFVGLWSQNQWSAATQLAATERLEWPLPVPRADPYEIMRSILAWEEDQPKSRAA